MQSPMMIAFLDSRQQQWRQEELAEQRLRSDDGRPCARSSLPPIVRLALVLALLGALLVSQVAIGSAHARPVCARVVPGGQVVSPAQMLPDLPLPPTMGTICGPQPVHPPLIVEEIDDQSLWAVVAELLLRLRAVVSELALVLH